MIGHIITMFYRNILLYLILALNSTLCTAMTIENTATVPLSIEITDAQTGFNIQTQLASAAQGTNNGIFKFNYAHEVNLKLYYSLPLKTNQLLSIMPAKNCHIVTAAATCHWWEFWDLFCSETRPTITSISEC